MKHRWCRCQSNQDPLRHCWKDQTSLRRCLGFLEGLLENSAPHNLDPHPQDRALLARCLRELQM